MCCSYEWQNGGWVLITDSCTGASCPNQPTDAPPTGTDGELHLEGCPDGVMAAATRGAAAAPGKKKPLVLTFANRKITIRGTVHVGSVKTAKKPRAKKRKRS